MFESRPERQTGRPVGEMHQAEGVACVETWSGRVSFGTRRQENPTAHFPLLGAVCQDHLFVLVRTKDHQVKAHPALYELGDKKFSSLTQQTHYLTVSEVGNQQLSQVNLTLGLPCSCSEAVSWARVFFKFDSGWSICFQAHSHGCW